MNRSIRSMAMMICGLWVFQTAAIAQLPSLQKTVRQAQSCVVKVYGAGGGQGLEAYQSGFLVSPDGHIATAWSYVLDVPPIIQLDDGSRYEAEVLEFEPRLELAILKIDAGGLPFFSVQSETVDFGDRVLAISNLFNIATGNEPASVMQGRVAAVAPLDARRGTFETPYRGNVLILDLVANNPGAAGGALINSRGNLIGMLGKELRDSATGVWINYAIPASVLRGAIGDMIAGRRRPPPVEQSPILAREKSHSPEKLGIIMIPDVLESTPSFVDDIVDRSPAQEAGLRSDDLILMVGGYRIDGQKTLVDRLRRIDFRDDVSMTIQRASDILTIKVRP